MCVLFSRGYKVPKNIKHLIDFSKVPARIDFDKEVKEILARGSGPGGQNVNKARNAVTLIHEPTRVVGNISSIINCNANSCHCFISNSKMP